MYLSPSGVRFYILRIVTTPPLTDWEASFDDGTTWVDGVQDDEDTTLYRWLLSGPLAGDDVDPAATPITVDVQPIVRAVDDPEKIALKAPYVALTTPSA